jgi:hypothetical protein
MTWIPVVASAAELPDAIKYAQKHPENRWYVARRAAAVGAPEQIPPEWGEALTAATAGADLSTDQLAALGKKGMALRNADGSYSYPTRNRGDLARAFQAFGRGKNKVALKRYLLRRARALHSTDLIPESWRPLKAAADTPVDEVQLWVSQVRDLIVEAGADPDALESGQGFESDFEGYKDNPVDYVAELLAAENEPEPDETGEDAATEESVPGDEPTEEPDPVSDPTEPAAAEGSPELVHAPPVAASVTNYSPTLSPGTPNVAIYTASQVAPPWDMEAVTAAIRAAVKDELEAARAVTVEAPSADEAVTAASTDLPVDLDAAKQTLRDRFNAHPKQKKKKPTDDTPPPPPVVPATAASMRERIAARSRS